MRDGAENDSGLRPTERSGQGVCTTRAAFGAATLLMVGLLSGCSTMTTSSSGIGSEGVSGQAGQDAPHRQTARIPAAAPSETSKDADELCSDSRAFSAGSSMKTDSDERLIWDRLRSGFSLSIPDDPRVEREWEWYASHPDYLERIQERASLYMHFILDELNKRDLPTELALLPVVESAYQPFAYSPGQAAGIWQFIPSTAHELGLKQTWWYDERRDVVAATRAALDYLGQLNSQFDGDWALTLAAYNAGAGNVAKAIRRNQRLGRPTDFWSLDLPAETETYVPKLFGIAKLFQDPEAAGLTLTRIPDKPYFTEVDVGGQIDLGVAAQMAGLSLDKLHLLNPGCNRWATDPEGPYDLLIPVEQREQFERALAELDPDKRLRWDRYQIRHGDSLSRIAHRYQTTVGVLREANNLKSNRVVAGHHLLIPVATAADIEYRKESGATALAAARGASESSRPTHYVVRAGDTLSEIAQRNDLSVRELIRWNSLSAKGWLHPGQKLALEQTQTDGKAGGVRQSLRYRVRKGDSLYTISRHFQVSVEDLRRWNKLTSNRLQPGQKLKVYLEVSEQSAL